MNSDQKIYRLAYWIACVIIAIIFLSGYYKILFPADFAKAVHSFNILPYFAVNIVALYLPWLEIVCAASLLFIPRYRIAALFIAFILLILFTGVIGINLLQGAVINCGCFRNSANHPMTWLNVARNVGLILLITLAWMSNRRACLVNKAEAN